MNKINQKTPFFLVTGFLGSGKTTFVKNFLNSYSHKYKVAVIQNEFASVNIDSKEIAQTSDNVKIIEMNNGSVFCVCLLPDFKTVLTDLGRSKKYDAIILEATGLADPIAITQLFHDPFLADNFYLEHIWTIVDAVNFDKIKHLKSVERQIRLADTVILNKLDDFNGNLLNLDETIYTLNPLAIRIKTSHCQTTLPFSLNSMINIQAREKKLCGIPVKRPNVGTAVIRNQQPVSRMNFDDFFKSIKKSVYRLKGVIRFDDGTSWAIQVVMDQLNTKQLDQDQNTEFIAIGPGIIEKKVTQLWQNTIHKENAVMA